MVEESTEFADINDVGYAVYGTAGLNPTGKGVWGHCLGGSPKNSPVGVWGQNVGERGLFGDTGIGVLGTSDDGNGVLAKSKSAGYPALYVENERGTGMYAVSKGKNNAVVAENNAHDHPTVYAKNKDGVGVYGGSDNSNAVYGESTAPSFPAVVGKNDHNIGVYGESIGGDAGVKGYSDDGRGVHAESDTNVGLYAKSNSADAAFLDGDVTISGSLQKGGGSFKIDHPLDPTNKYLCHSFVESPDMKNVYDGVVMLDDKGEAEIYLPDWFGALNKDFRYQLTAIGAPGPNLYIAEEIISDSATTKHGSHDDDNNGDNGDSFKIAGGTSGMKVSWQVTGIRKDPWANAHRVQVEGAKPDNERGYYIYPHLYGQPAENEISHLPLEKKARMAHK
jgi:hypothetical protein